MPTPAEHRFSVEDYYRLAETGVLRPDARVELLDGRVIDMSPIGPYHGSLVMRLARLFTLRADGRWIVSVQNPLRLGYSSEPQPDVMLLKPATDDYASRHPQPEDVFLLIEVSDTTLDYDRGVKLPAYSRAGIPEVWILDLDSEAIEVCCEPNFESYSSKAVLRGADQAKPRAFPDATVEVTELLRR